MKTIVAAGLAVFCAGAAWAGGLAEVTDFQDIIVATPAPTHDWVVLVLLTAVLAAALGS